MRIRSSVCKCTAEGVSPRYVHGSGGQPWGSRLVVGIPAVTEALTGCQCCSGAGEKQGGTQLTGISESKYMWDENW